MSRNLSSKALARRPLLGVGAVALAAVLGACGGSDSGAGSSGTTASSGASATSSATGMSTSGSTGTASGTSASGMSAAGMSTKASVTHAPVTPGPAAPGAHNGADVAFATDMIPHHGQAVEMADTILASGSTASVRALAVKIKGAQSPEIATMSGWLKGWGEQVPNPYGHESGMSGMSHSGMMTDQQMKELDAATGAAADKIFLKLMIEHHRGAVAMARTELANGTNAEAKKLAQAIITAQTAEIAQMTTMLTTLG